MGASEVGEESGECQITVCPHEIFLGVTRHKSWTMMMKSFVISGPWRYNERAAWKAWPPRCLSMTGRETRSSEFAATRRVGLAKEFVVGPCVFYNLSPRRLDWHFNADIVTFDVITDTRGARAARIYRHSPRLSRAELRVPNKSEWRTDAQ